MVENSEYGTGTIPIRRMPVEKKTVPLICPWCNRIVLLKQWDVPEGKTVKPTHGICPKCLKKLKRSQ